MHKHSITKRSRMNNPTWYISTSLISQFSSLRLLRRLCLPEVAALFQLKCLSLCVCVSTSLSPTLQCSSIGIWNALESDNISCIRNATQRNANTVTHKGLSRSYRSIISRCQSDCQLIDSIFYNWQIPNDKTVRKDSRRGR